MKLLANYKKQYKQQDPEVMSLEAFIKLLKKDKGTYATAQERMLMAIGEPEIVDTANDRRLSRIFGNRLLKRYKPFEDFYGMEPVVEKIVSYFKHAAQGLEESRQILYLLGPVGSAKSSIAEVLKSLMEKQPIYILKGSPIYESPLGLFDRGDAADLGIEGRYLDIKPSPWALKKLEEFEGDVTKFKVEKVYPNQLKQIALSKTEPGDENNQDISALVGKLDIRKLEFFAQNDPFAYNYSGGLCLSNQGLLEFVEMFKAPIKVLHPLLTATQEKNYKGTEAIGAIPFDGIILAHSNESEWDAFKNNKNNEAFIDRVYIVRIPYCLRVREEVEIYQKLLRSSSLADSPCAPHTLKMLAEFSVLTRLDEPENSDIFAKMKVYDGQNMRQKMAKVKSLQEYKDKASKAEGFFGISTRLAYKILAEVFNYDISEVAANPVHLLTVLQRTVEQEFLPEAQETKYLAFVTDYLAEDYFKKVGKDIQTAYLDSYKEYGQSLFDRYILYADYWCQDNDYRDAETGQMMNRDALNDQLEGIEKEAGIANPKDFRHEVVTFSLRYQAKHSGNNPSWTSYEKLRRVIEANMFTKTEDLLPIISFVKHKDKDSAEKHAKFVDRMMQMGYTKKQVKLVFEWYERYRKSN